MSIRTAVARSHRTPASGDGYLVHDGGKGNITLRQGSGGTISFCLTVEADGKGTGLVIEQRHRERQPAG